MGVALVLGLVHEPPIVAVTRALQRAGARYVQLNQRELVSGSVVSCWIDGRTSGYIEFGADAIPLDTITGVYTRLTAWSSLPEVAESPALEANARLIHAALEGWLESTPARVMNRTSANDSNNSKPYQAMIIRDYFSVPATLVTNDDRALTAFRREYPELIYKSASGERSIVTRFSDADLARLPLLATVPVQFQEYVAGVDVRVHVVGERVFATRVDSAAVDYRYDSSGNASMSSVSLPSEIEARCVALARRLGLELAGIDLRFADDGRVVCFEVNPSPGFTAFSDETGQPIAEAIGERLLGE